MPQRVWHRHNPKPSHVPPQDLDVPPHQLQTGSSLQCYGMCTSVTPGLRAKDVSAAVADRCFSCWLTGRQRPAVPRFQASSFLPSRLTVNFYLLRF